MHAKTMVHKLLEGICPWMHATRRMAFQATVLGALNGGQLTVTGMGRALTIYEEVHDVDCKEKPCTHQSLLDELQHILPEGSRPILVTDAGFRTPWFKQVAAMGWDWVGRFKNGQAGDKDLCHSGAD